MKIVQRGMARYSTVEEIVSLICTGWLVAFMMAVITLTVLGRYLFNFTISGIEEAAAIMMVVIAFLSLSGVQKEKGHIAMALLEERLSGRLAGAVLGLVVLLLAMVVAVIITYVGVMRPLVFYRLKAITEVLYIPYWIVSVFLPIGFLMLLVRLGLQIKQQVSIILKGEYKTKQSTEISGM